MNCEADGAKLVEIGSQSENTHLGSLLTTGICMLCSIACIIDV